jgi:hypothetical protein
MRWLALNILNPCNFVSMSIPCLAGIQCSMSSLWTQLGSTKYWSTSNYSRAIKVTMSEPFFSSIMLYKIQPHQVKNYMQVSFEQQFSKTFLQNSKWIFYNTFPSTELSTTLVPWLNCLLNNNSKIVQRTLPCLWSIINHGNNG